MDEALKEIYHLSSLTHQCNENKKKPKIRLQAKLSVHLKVSFSENLEKP